MGDEILIILVLLLSTIQSLVGVGILVLGTPLFLILGYDLVSTINFLLPISIITSFLNLLVIIKQKHKIFNSLNYLKSLFIYCLPSVFIGLQILKMYEKVFNFDYLVSFIIILTIGLRSKIKKIVHKISKFKSRVILTTIGISHGLTNSGGALLSIFLLLSNKSKSDSRSEITLFYFILAFTQLLIFYLIFKNSIITNNILNNLPSILGGVFLGNYLVKKVNFKIFSDMIYILALSSGVFLIIKNIYKIF